MNIGGKIYYRYMRGDHLTDSEVDQGMEIFKKLADAALAAGPAFAIAFKEANRVYLGLQDIYFARRR